ncbi:hypothetical protein COT75_01320 [Candidatus Beckwithbacteria bacterium CG10_big_fil_rev_8_21_14_0_10_34_10]|uniref:Glycosyltransferase 2-like domain-containing protein n=1 Tax=Candidatus Beckwithbacteria bacterium CG10_big_fil_rev_8_21_14_0_10_34_10 TaxID=1974495 RepID=A0A2H0WA02_9BACT|nr:MAG: hypothetical protein COT75_01320 [Candidatus Beckwithbacteria bacterium CG10_big_fil_rev_8_21_14_0_10_34_10]
MSSKDILSVIIITFKRNGLLQKCLESLVSQLSLTEEIVIVDNYKKGYAKKICQNFKKKLKIKYFYEPKKGPSYARNLGFKKSKGKEVVFLDDDCLVCKNWLKKIRYLLDSNPSENLIFQGKINHIFEVQNSLSNFFYWQNENAWQEIKAGPSWNLSKNYLNFINAGNFFGEKRVFSQLDCLFDARRFPYICEEKDLAYRCQLKGIGIVYAPKAAVNHIKDKPTLRKLIKRSFMTGKKEALLESKYKIEDKKILNLFKAYFNNNKYKKTKLGIRLWFYFFVKKIFLILGKNWGRIFNSETR